MTVRPPVVVLGWLAGNLALAGTLFAFDERLEAELLYLAAALPVLIFGLAAGFAARGKRPPQEYVTLPAGMGYPGVAAFGVLLCGIGVIYAQWIIIVGGLVIAYALFGLWRAPRTPDPPPAVVDTPAQPRP